MIDLWLVIPLALQPSLKVRAIPVTAGRLE